MRWRVIPIEVRSAAMNMAIDETISASVSDGANPTIRFYKWLPSAVSIGYFQSLNDVVNKKYCKRNGVNIVRRRTGGGAVYHSNKGEITYSVIGPVESFPKNIIESYKLGANSYIRKPVDFEGFCKTIKTLGKYWLELNKHTLNPTG